MKRNRGFTLIELMIVVAIVAILAAVALPAYGDYVKRGKITEAIAVLADMRVKIEQYYADNRTYVGYACTPTASPKAFAISCTIPDANTYEIKATGSAGEDMSGFVYTINQSNVRGSTTPWGDQANCWVMRKGGQC